ncbi:MAG: sigma-54-dependent Fis family transcriptional regulator [Planctomycetes bacterium]|nr:sigma-54-dependent Fis family transcriptional regulator [Planctomycetota bacterium]
MEATGPATVLVVDDSPSVRDSLQRTLARCGYAVVASANGMEAMDALRRTEVQVVVADLRMPLMDGLKLLSAARAVRPAAQFVLLSAFGTVEKAVEAMKLGACDFLVKPFRREVVCAAVEKALRRWHRQVAEPVEADPQCGLVGRSPALLDVLRVVRRVAPSSATVLIEGESGTGKELVADALHSWSRRADGPLVKVSCAALPETLLEAELFGHERGAFTGALFQKKGRFELAHGGTLFLDEVAQLSPAVQVKLLRVLQAGEFERLGGTQTLKADVRLVAATNTNLEGMLATGRFREDLYYRLNVVRLQLPPLRERREDIPLLADHFVALYRRRNGRQIEGISGAALELLLNYPWPGNVRELEHAIERAVVLAEGPILQPGDLPCHVATIEHRPREVRVPLGTTLREVEDQVIRRTLAQTGGDKTAAAALLGIGRRTIYRHLDHEDPAPD